MAEVEQEKVNVHLANDANANLSDDNDELARALEMSRQHTGNQNRLLQQFWVRHLIIDTQRGKFLKVDRHKYIRVAYHGFNPIFSTTCQPSQPAPPPPPDQATLSALGTARIELLGLIWPRRQYSAALPPFGRSAPPVFAALPRTAAPSRMPVIGRSIQIQFPHRLDIDSLVIQSILL